MITRGTLKRLIMVPVESTVSYRMCERHLLAGGILELKRDCQICALGRAQRLQLNVKKPFHGVVIISVVVVL